MILGSKALQKHEKPKKTYGFSILPIEKRIKTNGFLMILGPKALQKHEKPKKTNGFLILSIEKPIKTLGFLMILVSRTSPEPLQNLSKIEILKS